MIVSSFGGVAVSGTYMGGKLAMAKTIKSLVAQLPEDPDVVIKEGGWLDSLGGKAAWNVSGMGTVRYRWAWRRERTDPWTFSPTTSSQRVSSPLLTDPSPTTL